MCIESIHRAPLHFPKINDLDAFFSFRQGFKSPNSTVLYTI